MGPPLEAIIRGAWLLRSGTDDDIATLVHLAELKSYPSGATIFWAGEEATHLYIVGQGIARLLVPPALQGVHEPDSATFGDVLGFAALVEPYLYARDAVAATDVSLAALPATRLRAFLEERPALGYRILKAISARMQRDFQRAIASMPRIRQTG